jgi:hypothetical protein
MKVATHLGTALSMPGHALKLSLMPLPVFSVQILLAAQSPATAGSLDTLFVHYHLQNEPPDIVTLISLGLFQWSKRDKLNSTGASLTGLTCICLYILL